MSKYIDISYPLHPNMAIYPNNPKFSCEKVLDIENGDSANVSRICMGSHTGTHIDAPAHVIKGGKTLDQISLERMNGKCKVFDATGMEDITKEYLEKLDIEKDDIVLFKTDNSERFHGDVVLDDYVTLTYEAAEYLVSKRIKMVGIDYMTIERPRNKRIPRCRVHEKLLKDNILILEMIDLKEVSDRNYELICMPLKISGADGCSIRVVLREFIHEKNNNY